LCIRRKPSCGSFAGQVTPTKNPQLARKVGPLLERPQSQLFIFCKEVLAAMTITTHVQYTIVAEVKLDVLVDDDLNLLEILKEGFV
jgi:hypothetical protein